MSVNERLVAVRELTGLSQGKLSQKLGFSRAFWGLVEKGASKISPSLLERLEDNFRINPEWLMHGRGEMLKSSEANFQSGRAPTIISPPNYSRPGHGDFAADSHEYVFVRRFDVNVSAGPGAIQVPQEDDESIAFTTTFMNKLRLNSDLCGLVRVKGNSMGATVPDGALVMIHFAEREVVTEGIYAFNRGEASFIKRIVPLDPHGSGKPQRLMILGDSIGATTETLSGPEMHDIQIIGRVRAVLTTFD